jgi:hypothetical protein
MASEHIDDVDIPAPGGDDTPPLMSRVPEPPPSHWGRRTSGSRFESEAYLRFFYGGKKPKESGND